MSTIRLRTRSFGIVFGDAEFQAALARQILSICTASSATTAESQAFSILISFRLTIAEKTAFLWIAPNEGAEKFGRAQ
jgi:hypothetical protein